MGLPEVLFQRIYLDFRCLYFRFFQLGKIFWAYISAQQANNHLYNQLIKLLKLFHIFYHFYDMNTFLLIYSSLAIVSISISFELLKGAVTLSYSLISIPISPSKNTHHSSAFMTSPFIILTVISFCQYKLTCRTQHVIRNC